MSFKRKRFLMKAFLQSQFEVMSVYEFQTKLSFYEDIFWVAVWSYLSLRVSNKSEFLWTHFLSFSLKLYNFMSFKQNLILIKTLPESQFEVMSVYEFHTKANSHENICLLSVWSYVCFWLSNKSEFLCRRLLTLSLKLCMFMSFKQKRILMNTFVKSQFEVI